MLATRSSTSSQKSGFITRSSARRLPALGAGGRGLPVLASPAFGAGARDSPSGTSAVPGPASVEDDGHRRRGDRPVRTVDPDPPRRGIEGDDALCDVVGADFETGGPGQPTAVDARWGLGRGPNRRWGVGGGDGEGGDAVHI